MWAITVDLVNKRNKVSDGVFRILKASLQIVLSLENNKPKHINPTGLKIGGKMRRFSQPNIKTSWSEITAITTNSGSITVYKVLPISLRST